MVQNKISHHFPEVHKLKGYETLVRGNILILIRTGKELFYFKFLDLLVYIFNFFYNNFLLKSVLIVIYIEEST